MSDPGPSPTPARVGVAYDPATRTLDAARAYERGRVKALVRRAIASALPRPLAERGIEAIVPEGASVLLKPNWVTHRNEGGGGSTELFTHPEVLLATLDEVLRARPAKVIVGDAPIQSCRWEELVTPTLVLELERRARSAGVPLEIVDFRRTHLRRGAIVSTVEAERRDRARYVLFDLGAESLLEPLSTAAAPFRVAAYDPRALAATHRPGVHQYLLCREAFEADVVISLPKLKTHCKAGLTGALKNLVGFNGNKDYLPHYRVGGPANGGDGYAGSSRIGRLADLAEDAANVRLGRRGHAALYLIERALRRVSGGVRTSGGAWHGNDTCWRMVLDLDRILFYGDHEGRMHPTPRRTFFSLTDAIVCGEGDGPLRPTALPLGAITFSGSPTAADDVHARLLGLDPTQIPLVSEAAVERRWSIAPGDWTLCLDGEEIERDRIYERCGVDARAPAGWRGRIERGARRAAATREAEHA